jgi:hypothetical protein
MSETNEQLEQRDASWDSKGLGIIAVASVLGQVFARNFTWLPYPLAIVLAYMVVLLVGYWIGRRPQESFGPFALRVVFYLLFLAVGIWAVAALLSKWIWPPLAFGGSILVFGILLYWLPPLLQTRKKRHPLWVWVIWVVVFAVIWGYLGSESLK